MLKFTKSVNPFLHFRGARQTPFQFHYGSSRYSEGDFISSSYVRDLCGGEVMTFERFKTFYKEKQQKVRRIKTADIWRFYYRVDEVFEFAKSIGKAEEIL